MAPPRKASVRKGNQAAARTPPATPRHARQPRQRSASPPNQPTPLVIRDEPPARSTRSWVSAAPISQVVMPTAEQRNPVDCPFIRCRAVTEHQHLPQLQYYRPRPDRAVRHRGLGNSNTDGLSSQRVRPALRPATQDDDTSSEAAVMAGDELAGQEQNVEEQAVAAGDNENGTQGSLTGEMGQSAAQKEPSSEETSEVEEGSAALENPATDEPVHKESESNLPAAPMTPPPSSPPAAEETIPSKISQESPEHQQQQDHSPPPAPQPQIDNHPPAPEPQNTTATPPTQHVHTLDELIRPLVDPTLAPAPSMAEITRILQTFRSPWDPSYRPDVDPDLPSLMLQEDDVDADELLPSLMAMTPERDRGVVRHFDVGEWGGEERMDWEAEGEGW